jgi:hypothetical protein
MLEDDRRLEHLRKKKNKKRKEEKRKVPFPEGTTILLMKCTTTITIIGCKNRQ